MKLEKQTKLAHLLEEYPFLVDELPRLSPMYERLKDKEMRKAMAPVATIEMVASLGGIELTDLLQFISRKVEERTGRMLEHTRSEDSEISKEKVEKLRTIVMDLHRGRTVQEVKGAFSELVKDVDATEIMRMEQSLIDSGVKEEEIKRLCDVHVEVFKETLDGKQEVMAPPGHPVDTFIKENRALEGLLTAFSALLNEVEGDRSGKLLGEKRQIMSGMLDFISRVDIHYKRKENQLFPVLEEKGVKGPSQVMWAVHDDIRKMLKDAQGTISTGDPRSIGTPLRSMVKALKEMVYKEERVLFPMCMEKFSDPEWARVKRGEEEIGFAWVAPGKGWAPIGELSEASCPSPEKIRLGEGYLTPEQLDSMLRSLPVDISFVDENNKVAYYSATNERIFPRSPGVIGRDVRNCHPPKSVHIVERIIEGFRTGKKDVAEFWIEIGGRFIHIRYFPVRAGDGRFLGTLEVTQDVTAIRALKGQRRLLDWE